MEKYLNKCIDSILKQTFQDFELILVDDGSPDKCPKICDEYAKKDKRVRVIHDYIRISAKLVTLLSSAIAFGLMGVSSVLAPVFFGDEFIACGEIIRLLSVTVFFIAWANVIRTQYLIPNKRDSIYLTSTMVGAILNLIINWMLIPKYQANGAAFGTIVAEFSVMLVQMVAVKNELPMRKYIMSYSPILIIGLIMAVLVDRIGIKLGVSVSTLAIQILAGRKCSLSAWAVNQMASGNSAK